MQRNYINEELAMKDEQLKKDDNGRHLKSRVIRSLPSGSVEKSQVQ
jgi:hypothetical protein